jgi:hypothetical protein
MQPYSAGSWLTLRTVKPAMMDGSIHVNRRAVGPAR